MLEFFQTIGAKVGTLFLSVALFLGASTPAVEPQSTVANESTSQAVIQETTKTPSLSTRTNTSVTKNQPASPSNNAPLSIEDVSVSVSARTATFTWRTTVEARSSLILSGETFDSTEGVSKTHTVSVKDLKKGVRYSYEINAKTLGASASEDKVTRQFSLPNTQIVTVEFSEDKKCYIFSVTNPLGEAISEYEFNVVSKNSLVTIPRQYLTTDSKGKVEYCISSAPMTVIMEGEDIDSVKGSSEVSVSGTVYKNQTGDNLNEYGTFLVTFQIAKQ